MVCHVITPHLYSCFSYQINPYPLVFHFVIHDFITAIIRVRPLPPLPPKGGSINTWFQTSFWDKYFFTKMSLNVTKMSLLITHKWKPTSMTSVRLPLVAISFLTYIDRCWGVWPSWCAVPFCIFQIRADEQCSGEISPVGDQCESAVGDQGKSG